MNSYESEKLLGEYLLFHYGEAHDLLPCPEGPHTAVEFPQRCVQLLMEYAPAKTESALDLGCAVGRATFALSRHFTRALGIDYSQSFIDAAIRLRELGNHEISIIEEGDVTRGITVQAPFGTPEFVRGDACALPADLGAFDAVLMANLICRLHDPQACLKRLPALVNPGGTLVITTPNTWLEEFTPRERWMRQGEKRTPDGLQNVLLPDFDLLHTGNLPFLIRETARKFQWTMAEASVWRRKA